jgi:hypothetical protein
VARAEDWREGFQEAMSEPRESMNDCQMSFVVF